MLALDRHRRQRSLGNFRPPQSRREISSPIVTQKTGTISWSAVTTRPIPIDTSVPLATVAGKVTVADAAGDTTTFPLLAGSATGNLPALTDPGLSYNANTNTLTATTFVGALTGTASGNDVVGSAAAAQAASQPLDSDLTAIAALTTPATTITNSTPYAFNMALILDT